VSQRKIKSQFLITDFLVLEHPCLLIVGVLMVVDLCAHLKSVVFEAVLSKSIQM